MRKHDKSFHIRLTQEEYNLLCEQYRKSGLSKSTYIRFMIKGQIPQEKPLPDYWGMKQELYRIGNNLQLTQSAHAKGWLRAGQLNDTLNQLNALLVKLAEYLVPHKTDVAKVLKCGQSIEDEECEGLYADVF